MTSISDNAADDDATPRDDGNELQMSKEMEPSLERTKGATLGMVRRFTQLESDSLT